MFSDQNFIVWLEENMTEQLDNLVGSISQNELGRIEIMVLGQFLTQGQTAFPPDKETLILARTASKAEGEDPTGSRSRQAYTHFFRSQAMLSGDLLDGLAWLVHRLVQHARVRKLG